ncbi:uncharacterized protein [Rutidosis leptorrhynchoides]|uniref:uncharacterized protein n=1 Tax=Rutidosis leptorrhynchoides TaxID=125765 RepID=UPI003A9A4D6D
MLYGQVITAIHGSRGGDIIFSSRYSNGTWASICRCVNMIHSSNLIQPSLMHIKLGNSSLTSFWYDPWIDGTPLALKFPRLLALEDNKFDTVADRHPNGSWLWFWRRDPRGGIELSNFNSLLDILAMTSLSNNVDTWTWDGDSSCGNSVAAARRLIDLHSIAPFSCPTNWLSLYPSKVNIFIWRLRMNRLATKDNLERKGIDLPNYLCVWCNVQNESVHHVFVSCVISKQIWSYLGSWINFNLPSWNNLEELWIWMDNLSVHEKKKIVVRSIFYSVLWNIWRLRNSYVFNDPTFRISHVLDNIIVTSFFFGFFLDTKNLGLIGPFGCKIL